MKTQPLYVGTVTILLLIGLCGCDQLNEKETTERTLFIGTWQNTTSYPAIIQFSSDGGCVYGGERGTWRLKDNKLTITLSDSGLVHDYSYWFSQANQTLLLQKTFGYSILYTRQ